jgi:hypothetical protein
LEPAVGDGLQPVDDVVEGVMVLVGQQLIHNILDEDGRLAFLDAVEAAVEADWQGDISAATGQTVVIAHLRAALVADNCV